jgi:hypothetical protein
MFYKIILSIVLLLSIQCTYAESSLYFLCGSDEDGCAEGREQYCACIPDISIPNQPYCFSSDWKSCHPFKKQSDCDVKFDNQAKCIAALSQSEPIPVCKEVTQSFCSSHSVSICDESGNMDSCKKTNTIMVHEAD